MYSGIKEAKNGWEVASLLCKQEGQSSDPQTPSKNWVSVATHL